MFSLSTPAQKWDLAPFGLAAGSAKNLDICCRRESIDLSHRGSKSTISLHYFPKGLRITIKKTWADTKPLHLAHSGHRHTYFIAKSWNITLLITKKYSSICNLCGQYDCDTVWKQLTIGDWQTPNQRTVEFWIWPRGQSCAFIWLGPFSRVCECASRKPPKPKHRISTYTRLVVETNFYLGIPEKSVRLDYIAIPAIPQDILLTLKWQTWRSGVLVQYTSLQQVWYL